MKRSTERILTTHVGSLIRTPDIMRGMKARTLGEPYDQARLAADIRQGINDVVHKQVEIGIDIPNDGEFARNGFAAYVNQRLGGLEPRPAEPDEQQLWSGGDAAEEAVFPDFFRQYTAHFRYLWMDPQIPLDDMPNRPGTGERFRVVAPVTYVGQAEVRRDIDTLRAALQDVTVADAFITAAPPGRRTERDIEKFYPNGAAYLYAVADALHEEYQAITDAGFVLQLDLAATSAHSQHAIEERVEVVNHALRGIPEEQVRYHHCWGSMNSPHTQDPPLKDFVAAMLRIHAQAYSIEAANPRHEHEWMLWQDVKLPDGKILIPGLISHQTNVVEHPELVAWRIANFASVVGKENVIAGADCGFAQHWDAIRVHPSVQWAKLQSLVDGAALTSRELWRK